VITPAGATLNACTRSSTSTAQATPFAHRQLDDRTVVYTVHAGDHLELVRRSARGSVTEVRVWRMAATRDSCSALRLIEWERGKALRPSRIRGVAGRGFWPGSICLPRKQAIFHKSNYANALKYVQLTSNSGAAAPSPTDALGRAAVGVR
jgi:hypothetical protein